MIFLSTAEIEQRLHRVNAARSDHDRRNLCICCSTARAPGKQSGVTHCIIDEIHALCPNNAASSCVYYLNGCGQITADQFVRITGVTRSASLDEVACHSMREADADAGICPRATGDDRITRMQELICRSVSLAEQFERCWKNRVAGDLPLARRRNPGSIVPLSCLPERCPPSVSPYSLTMRVEIARAHHGSVPLEQRQQIESALKEGLPAVVVATASLELGIDMGAVDLACQVESPGNVCEGPAASAGPDTSSVRPARAVSSRVMPADLLEQLCWAREMVAAVSRRSACRSTVRLPAATACREGGDGHRMCPDLFALSAGFIPIATFAAGI